MLTPELILRPAEAADVAAIAEMEKICFATPWSEESIMHELTKNPLAHYIVAELEGKVVGYVGFWQKLKYLP